MRWRSAPAAAAWPPGGKTGRCGCGTVTAAANCGRSRATPLAFDADGGRLATASWDGTVRAWHSATGEPAFTLEGHTGPVYGVAFSPDSQRLATGSEDRLVKIWDAHTGSEILCLKGHTDTIR